MKNKRMEHHIRKAKVQRRRFHMSLGEWILYSRPRSMSRAQKLLAMNYRMGAELYTRSVRMRDDEE